MGKRLYIDQQECMACESCVELCPEAFRMSSEGEYAEVIDPYSKAECVEDAISTCPVECISWQEE
ncbi:ferredoxin [Nitratidesulfovibrio vulgaris]|jgi:ferredoxin|uniref:Ferredoxin n=1 Tax=Nitratidesulfovibrio vulgaris (strain DP4) TaxID=391774 RepID=A0A0H3AB94_NITV4|nr:ferredoxin [Nitratidesulfovibrio vulgaris]ABM29688.1 4Fe-4S ferredoxin, iron-sulfur binding domain protein [Nitratidesulfovibrio vulgaris DP4]WCB46988.1 ferredoxin [Nitratidesulfovibrio vulgaris]GEB80152.1 ferredoxin [Desulfovibrio desulfuricans]HBW17456.1 ferredoxin [Desulfovibrio sp.]